MSASAGPPTAPAPARPRLTRTDAGLIAAGATYLVVRRAALPFAAKDVALPLALWFAWLFVGLAWSPYKAGAFNYIAIVVTMIALVLATAAALYGDQASPTKSHANHSASGSATSFAAKGSAARRTTRYVTPTAITSAKTMRNRNAWGKPGMANDGPRRAACGSSARPTTRSAPTSMRARRSRLSRTSATTASTTSRARPSSGRRVRAAANRTVSPAPAAMSPASVRVRRGLAGAGAVGGAALALILASYQWARGWSQGRPLGRRAAPRARR